MSNIFSASNLLEANFVKPINIEKINIQECYFTAALNYLEEMNKDISTSTKVLYKSILEAEGNAIIINESFSSFCESIKKIIQKFLEFLKRIAQKFILTMNKLVKSEKYITNHKDDIKKFGAEDTFKMDIYNFTHLVNDALPLLNPEDEWKQGQGFSAKDPTTSLLARTTTIYNDLKKELDGGWYDGFRGRVVGKALISSEDFADELFELFRDGSKTKSDTEFSYDGVIDSLNRFNEYNNSLKHVVDCKKNLEKGYTEIKKEIEGWAKAGTDGKSGLNIIVQGDNKYSEEYSTHKKEIDEQADLFIKVKVAQVDHMCKIHAMAFTAKLDAIKDCFCQDKAILYKALSKVKSIKAHKESVNNEDGEGEQLYGLFNL